MKETARRASRPATGVLTFVAIALTLLMLGIVWWALGTLFGS